MTAPDNGSGSEQYATKANANPGPSTKRMDQRITRPCHACGGKQTCRWADDAWHCTRCDSEWDEEHNPIYAPPGSWAANHRERHG